MRFAHNQEVKSDPQLDIIAQGTQCTRMTSRMMTSANFSFLISGCQGM